MWFSRITKRILNDKKASRGRVVRIMGEIGTRSKIVKEYKTTINSKHNLLNREFAAQKPNEKLVTDIACISTEEGSLYLADVFDLYGRKLTGWATNSRMRAELVVAVLKQAIGRTAARTDILVHLD